MKPTIAVLTVVLSTVPASAFAQQQTRTVPVVNFGAGLPGERYDTLCQGTKGEMDRSAEVNCVNAGGSYGNATGLSKGELNAALLQANVRQAWESINGQKLAIVVLGESHLETVHLACRENLGIGDIDDLIEKKPVVSIGGEKSGHFITWTQLEEALPALRTVPSRPYGDDESINLLVSGEELGCIFRTAGVGGASMKTLNVDLKGKVVLAETWHDAFTKIKDADGKPMFRETVIKDGTYSNMQPGFWSSDYAVASVPALVVITKDFNRDNAQTGRQLVRSLTNVVAQGK